MRQTIDNIEHVKSIIGHKDVFETLVDDLFFKGSLFKDQFVQDLVESLLEDDFVYVLGPNNVSLFIFMRFNAITFLAHSMVLPKGRGKEAIKAGRKAIKYMFSCTPCKKIIGFTPFQYKHANRFNRLVGLKREGCLTGAWSRHGVVDDLVIWGLAKEG